MTPPSNGYVTVAVSLADRVGAGRDDRVVEKGVDVGDLDVQMDRLGALKDVGQREPRIEHSADFGDLGVG